MCFQEHPHQLLSCFTVVTALPLDNAVSLTNKIYKRLTLVDDSLRVNAL